MKALILAAGYATRLYPLTKVYPKPLLKVGRKAIIDYIVDKLDRIKDINEIIVVSNHKFISRFEKWSVKAKTKKRISLVDDLTENLQERRGAIGDMYFAISRKRINDDLLVIGGDNLFDESLEDFISFAKSNRPYPSIGAFNIKDINQAGKYGVIKLDKKYRIVDFQEKPKKPKSTLVAMCLYYFPKVKLKLIKDYIEENRNKHDATGFYISWLRKKEPVYGFVFKGHWYDIGDSKFYRQAKHTYKSKEDKDYGSA